MNSPTQQEAALAFTGPQTIAGVEDARKRLLLFLEQPAAGLRIDCHGVDDCDLAFVQVLIATQRSATTRGIGLRLIGSPALTAACTAAGVELAELAGSKGD